jgi:o-succinylbenzoate synthase
VIRSLAVRPYRLEWAEPTGDARGRFREREGLLLELRDEEGRVGLGEAAPLPGRTSENLAECREALASLEVESLPNDFRTAWHPLPPSLTAARHALESALLELEARRLGVPTWQVLVRALGRTAPVAALEAAALVDQQALPAALEAARRSIELGFRTLKLKIGREPVERIVERVRAVERAFPAARLRLDANRTLSPDEASSLSQSLRSSAIEFLEEPFEGATSGSLELPLALDESLQDPGFDVSNARASVLVLKPMLLGLARCLEIAATAPPSSKLVISHCFDGPHAMATARSLALALGPGRPADGLGGHAVLAAWPESVPERLRSHRIEPWTAPGNGVSTRGEA